MKHKLPLRFYWLFICELAFRFIAPFVIPFLMLFLKKANMEDIKDKIPYNIGTDIQRYIFPKWAECVEMLEDYNWPEYEPAMSSIRKKFGWQIATYINLAFRNVGSGVMAEFAVPVSDYWYKISDKEKQEKGLFDDNYRLGSLVLKVGWVSYKDWKNRFSDTGFFACPCITLRWEKKDEV